MSAENDRPRKEWISDREYVIHDEPENDAAVSLRRQVKQIETYSRKMGCEVPEGALVCLPYQEARALLRVIPSTEEVPDD